MMDNLDILLGEEPQEQAVQEQPAPQPEPQQAQPQPPMPEQQGNAFDPSLYIGALESIHNRLDGLSKPQEQPKQLSEEDMILQELADKMGLGSIRQENEQLKKMLEQTTGQTQQMQEYIQQQQIASVQNQILSKYQDQGITKDMVVGKLYELANQYGEDFANSLNNSSGWEYVITTQLQKPQSKPDPIVSTESTGDDFLDSAMDRVKKGKPSQGDIGELLFSYL